MGQTSMQRKNGRQVIERCKSFSYGDKYYPNTSPFLDNLKGFLAMFDVGIGKSLD